MDVSERLLFLALGCGIGFIFGYMIRSLSCIQRDLKDVKRVIRLKDDSGLSRYPLLLDICLFIVVAITVYSAVQSQIASNHSDNATDKVKKSDVVACENANESRQANDALWTFVINLSLASPGNQQSPKATRYLHTIQKWVDDIYQKHDCSDLTRKYPIPPAPKIITFPGKHKHKHK